MEYFAAIKNKVFCYVLGRTDLKGILLSEKTILHSVCTGNKIYIITRVGIHMYCCNGLNVYVTPKICMLKP